MKAMLCSILMATALAGCSTPSMAASVQDKARSSVVSLSTVVQGQPLAFCAGAVLSKHEILTATHCLSDMADRPVLVNGVLVKWEVVKQDQNDHVVVKVDVVLEGKPVKMAKRPLKEGDRVFYWGHPYGVPSLLYREGYYAGHQYMNNTHVDFYAVQGWRGDSGTPVFNEKGEVVGTMSIYYGEGPWHVMGVFGYGEGFLE